MKWIICAVLGSAIAASPLLARQEPEDKEKPRQEEPKGKQDEKKPKQEEPKQQPSQEKPKANAERQQQPEAGKQQAGEKEQKKEQKDAQRPTKESEKENRNAENAPRDNRQQQPGNAQQSDRGQRSAQESRGGAQRIPQERFQTSFGREHHFHVRHLDDRKRFQYGGYWFEVTQPWPTGWSYDDDCYIEDDDGSYYLVDLLHPDIRVLVIVVEA